MIRVGESVSLSLPVSASASEQPTGMVSRGVLGEQGRVRQGSIVGVVGVRRVDQAVRIAREQGARAARAVEQRGRGRRDGYPGREDEGCAEGRRGRPHLAAQARQESLALGGRLGDAPPLLVAGCNVEGYG